MVIKYIVACVIICMSCRWCQCDEGGNSAGEQNYSNIDPLILRYAKVKLQPPANITFYLIEPTEAVIVWAPPEVYHMYDVNTTLIDPPSNETFIWNNITYGGSDDNDSDSGSSMPQNGVSTSAEGVTSQVVPDNSTSLGNDSASKSALCKSLDYFMNYTVDFNKTDEALTNPVPDFFPLKDIYKPEKLNIKKSEETSIVPFAQGCVKEYTVVYYPSDHKADNKTMTVNASDTPEVHLMNLIPETNYTLYIVAVFISNHTMRSVDANFATVAKQDQTVCLCDPHGAVRISACNSSAEQSCLCSAEYAGKFCEQCKPGYYRTAPYFPCHRCPCDKHSSKDNSCYFQEGFLKCQQCHVGYTGNICHMCDYGYYRHRKYCVPCHCHSNHNASFPYMCDMFTGSCNCVHNASGFNCETCPKGFEGDAIYHKNCTKITRFDPFEVLPEGVIAGICVGIILVLSFIIGSVIYVRMSKNPPKRPFWTVELKDDHEGVNFNSVPNDDFQIVDPRMNTEDQGFYESQGGATQSQGKYARLQEQA